MMNRPSFLLLVIFLEGYVVLSTELLAIRSTLPYVGSGTDTLSIIIAAVLMPLALGYYAGGQFRAIRLTEGVWSMPRRRLSQNFMVSAIILTIGLSYVTLEVFFELMIRAFGIHDRIALTAIYSLMFLSIPVYLLGQTIPLISHFFPRERLSAVAGKILFFSTVGSFMGAVFCTLVLMTFFGVHTTVIVTIACLTVLTLLISRHPFRPEPLASVACLAAAFLLNSGFILEQRGIVENNRYNMIAVFESEDGNRHLSLNKNFDSMLGPKGEKHAYVDFVERTFLRPISPQYGNRTPKDILVVGAGGFTFGLEDEFNEFDYVDIDGSLKEVAEEYFLKEPLGENKRFHPVPVRAFLTEADRKYDLIFLDAFYGHMSIPEHLVTREFFEQVKGALKPGGVMVANFIASPNFGDAFSRNIDTTLRSVFPFISRESIYDYDGWDTSEFLQMNVMYIYHNVHAERDGAVYTDDKNRMFLDKPRSSYGP